MIRGAGFDGSSHGSKDGQGFPKRGTCRAFRNLKVWQVRQYRTAVDENKWYMSERLGREVSWTEAERDFVANDYYDCAGKWRCVYCSEICSFFSECSLGQLLVEKQRCR